MGMMSLMLNGKAARWTYVAIALMLSAFSTLYIVKNGAICDVWILCTQQLQTYKGLIPLKDIWGPFSVSSWLMAGILWFPNLILGGKYLLASKICHAMISLLAVAASSGLLKRIEQDDIKWQLFLGGLTFYLFLPDYLYSFMCHYTLCYNIIILSTALIISIRYGKRVYKKTVALSLISGIGVLAMPQYIIIVIAVFVILCRRRMVTGDGISDCDECRIDQKTTGMTITIYIGVLILIAFSFIVFLVLNQGSISDLTNILADTTHQESLAARFVKRSLVIVVIFGCDVIVWVLMRLLSLEEYVFSILSVGFMAIWLISAVLTHNLILMMRIGYTAVIALGIWSCIFGYKEVEDKSAFQVYCVLGVLFSYTAGVFTDTGAMIMAMGFVFPLAGYMIYRKKQGNKWKYILPVTSVIIVFLLQRLILIDGYNYTTASGCKCQIESGFLKDLYVSDGNYDSYNFCDSMMKKYTDKDDVILILNGGIYACGYGLSDALPGVSDYYYFPDIDSRIYLDYWNEHEDRIPNKVFLFDDLALSDVSQGASKPVVEYILQNYEKAVEESGMTIYSRKRMS